MEACGEGLRLGPRRLTAFLIGEAHPPPVCSGLLQPGSLGLYVQLLVGLLQARCPYVRRSLPEQFGRAGYLQLIGRLSSTYRPVPQLPAEFRLGHAHWAGQVTTTWIGYLNAFLASTNEEGQQRKKEQAAFHSAIWD